MFSVLYMDDWRGRWIPATSPIALSSLNVCSLAALLLPYGVYFFRGDAQRETAGVLLLGQNWLCTHDGQSVKSTPSEIALAYNVLPVGTCGQKGQHIRLAMIGRSWVTILNGCV